MLHELSKKILHALVDVSAEAYRDRLVSIVVFGSVGRGTHSYYSDVDILLVVRDLPNGRMNRMREFEAVEKKLEDVLSEIHQMGWIVSLSPIIRTPEEIKLGGYLYLDMVDDAKILYDKDHFFTTFLDDYKQRLKRYGAGKSVHATGAAIRSCTRTSGSKIR